MIRPHRFLIAVFVAVFVVVGLGAAAVQAAETGQDDRGFLANMISGLLSGRGTTVSIGAVEGALSADVTVRDIVISDSLGPWFHLDRIKLVWNRGALFSRRLEIDTLDIGKIDLARRPVATEPAVPGESILPELPLKLEIKAFSLAELNLAQSAFGTAARLTASGKATLGKPSEGLHLAFESRHLDRPGSLAARLSFVPETEALEISAKLDEPAGGFLAKLIEVPGEPPVHFDLGGSGTLNAFTAKLALDGGPVLGATGSADLRREGAARRLLLALDTRLTAGVLPAPVAVLFAGAGQLQGDLRFADDGVIDLTRLVLTAPGARLDLTGRTLETPGPLRVEGRAEVAVPDLSRFAELTGQPLRGAITATLNGTAGTDRADVTATLAGEVDRKPIAGHLRLLRPADGTVKLENLDLTVGSVTAKGTVTLDSEKRAVGALAVTGRRLGDLSPLIPAKLAGSLAADLKLTIENGRQVVRFNAGGSGLHAATMAIAKLDGHGEVTDPLNRPVITATVSADGVTVAGERVPRLRLTANGAAAASDLVLSARIRDIDLEARGKLLAGDAPRLDLAAASARRGGHRVALAGPASLTFADGTLELHDLTILVDGGRVNLRGKAGRTLDLALTAHGVPLAAAELVIPGQSITGILDGDATIGGSTAAPRGTYRVTLKRLTTGQLRDSGAPPLDITAAGSLRDRRADVTASIFGGRGTEFQVRGSVPLRPQDALDLTLRGKIDAGLANATLAAGGRHVTGNVAVDMRATGPMTRPNLNGTAVLSEGSYRDTAAGVDLDKLQARLSARGTALTLDSASAITRRNGGSVSARGTVRLDPASGFPGVLHLEGKRAELIADGTMTVVADLALDVNGPLTRSPAVTGRVETVSVDVRIPGQLPTKLKPLDTMRHLHATGVAAAHLADLKREAEVRQAHRQRATVFNATLDITVSSPGRVFVRGHGLDAELGGDLRITGSSNNPKVVGAYTSRRGRLEVLGTRLDFSKGRLSFTGDLMPELDFLAESKANATTVQVEITGPANQPTFAFTSQPTLPQDEVLSRLLFSKASGKLSPFQALQLAHAITQFSGGGDDAFDRLRRSLGIDNLDIRTDTGGASVALSRAISNRISIGVKAGATPEQSGLSADIDLTNRLRLKNEIDARGSTSIGIGAEWEY
ncbi:MAG: translocation/assembly module TamB domain-containing protein [Rhodospirillaceae bacterium]